MKANPPSPVSQDTALPKGALSHALLAPRTEKKKARLDMFLSSEESDFLGQLGIFSCEKLASADRWDLSRELRSFYKKQLEHNQYALCSLKVCEARVYAWMIRMNRTMRQMGLPSLKTRNGPNSMHRNSDDVVLSDERNCSTKGILVEELESKISPVVADEGEILFDTNKKRDRPQKEVKARKKHCVSSQSIRGARDTKAAEATLLGADDLISLLSLKERTFLSQNFWIFTIQQLDFILNKKSSDNITSVSGHPIDSTGNTDSTNQNEGKPEERKIRMRREERHREVLRTMLIDKLIKSPQNFLKGICNTEDKNFLNNGEKDEEVKNGSTKVNRTALEPKKRCTPNGVASECVKRDEIIGSIMTESISSEDQIGPVDEFQNELDQRDMAKSRNAELMRERAQSVLLLWEEKIVRWKANSAKIRSEAIAEKESLDQTQFLLSGTLSILFPSYLLVFLETVGISTAYGFLSARKTEVSYVMERLIAWRHKSNMVQMKPVSFSRLLLGLTARLHVALSNPPADKFARDWVGGSLVVLTGAAREFTVDYCQIRSEAIFVSTQTKALSDKLCQWRESIGMAALKGTGTVATISGWKALVKEFMVTHMSPRSCPESCSVVRSSQTTLISEEVDFDNRKGDRPETLSDMVISAYEETSSSLALSDTPHANSETEKIDTMKEKLPYKEVRSKN